MKSRSRERRRAITRSRAASSTTRPNRSTARASTPGCLSIRTCSSPRNSQQTVRGELQRGVRLPLARKRPILAEEVPDSAWRHEHRAGRLAVQRTRHRARHRRQTALSRAVLLGAGSRGSRQQSVFRQRLLLPNHTGDGQSQPEDRRREFHLEPRWRELAKRDELRLPVRLPDHRAV
jgi:hypothetical protein